MWVELLKFTDDLFIYLFLLQIPMYGVKKYVNVVIKI